jgi:hypothetical protein
VEFETVIHICSFKMVQPVEKANTHAQETLRQELRVSQIRPYTNEYHRRPVWIQLLESEHLSMPLPKTALDFVEAGYATLLARLPLELSLKLVMLHLYDRIILSY